MIGERTRELVTHPAALASYIASSVGGLLALPPDVVLMTFWESLGTIFGAVSIAGFTVADRLPWLPAGSLQFAALGLGVLLIGKRLGAVYSRLQKKADS